MSKIWKSEGENADTQIMLIEALAILSLVTRPTATRFGIVLSHYPKIGPGDRSPW